MLKQIRNIGFKVQVTILVVVFSTIAIIVTATISSIRSKASLIDISKGQLQGVAKMIANRTDEYFKSVEIFTNSLSEDRLIEGMIIAFDSAFYGGGFKTFSDQKILSPYYMKNEEKFGKRIRGIASNYKMKNILLVSNNYQVIMTSTIDKDYHFLGRHLKNGPLKDSDLANCVKSAFVSEKSEIVFSDYNFYEFSNNVHSFFCQKVRAEFDYPADGVFKGDTLGVVIAELDIGDIQESLNQRDGLGETGQYYILGDDKKLRSSIPKLSEQYQLASSIKDNITIESISAENAYKGEVGFGFVKNPIGKEVLSIYSPINVNGKIWAFVAEKELSEITEPVRKMIIFISIASGLLTLVISAIAWLASKKLTKPVSDSSVRLSSLAKNIDGNAESVKKYSVDLRESSGNLASSIQETVSTMDEITQMVNKNLENVDLSTTLSETSRSAANQGLDTVTRMLGAMGDINNTNKNISAEMKDLSDKMIEIIAVIEEIGSKTSVINDIVFQTKLLSFNASVEAARAGEHGKGFAVVAEEVGNLAAASGSAATEISTMLHDSVTKVQSIIDSSKEKIGRVTSDGVSKIEMGQKVAGECGEQLKSILDNVTKVHQAISEVKLASQEQATGIREVSKAMQILDQVSNDTQQISTDIFKVAEELDNGSNDLGEVVKDINNLLDGSKSSS